jgi:predicted lysophospholipase L1 biosynthesis ABC-type transport system permease subunit
LILVVVCFRRWPASYGAYSLAVLLVAMSAANLDSLERYGLSAFPLVLALAGLLRAPWLERTALVLTSVGLTTYATLAFLGAYVP